jgi:hypothetical protein
VTREPCPFCGLLYEHRMTCQLAYMHEYVSSILVGWPNRAQAVAAPAALRAAVERRVKELGEGRFG